MEPLDSEDHKTLQEGREAQELLANQTFLNFVEVLKEAYKNQLFDSKPEDSALREELYRRSMALDDLLHVLNISASRAISLAQALMDDAQIEDYL